MIQVMNLNIPLVSFAFSYIKKEILYTIYTEIYSSMFLWSVCKLKTALQNTNVYVLLKENLRDPIAYLRFFFTSYLNIIFRV